MIEDSKKGCDVDDLMCQFGVMIHLEGMQKLLGNEKFKVRYPEFAGLGETVAERIAEQEITLKEALERCGGTPTEPPTEILKEVEE